MGSVALCPLRRGGTARAVAPRAVRSAWRSVAAWGAGGGGSREPLPSRYLLPPRWAASPREGVGTPGVGHTGGEGGGHDERVPGTRGSRA